MNNILTTEILHEAIEEGKFIFITKNVFEEDEETMEKAKYERKRQEYYDKQDKIIELIKSEAEAGIIHTMESFGIKFHYQHNLYGKAAICNNLDCMGRNRLINFFNNPEDYGIACPEKDKKKMMFMCVPNMKVKVGETQVEVLPSHYKSMVYGSIHKL
jgi:hypothetical protein